MQEIESWQNGEWIPNSKIGTKLWDAHYFFGWAVFDAFRTYKHIPHLMEEHIDRLDRSARLAEIDFDMTKQDMMDIVFKTMEHNMKFFPIDEEYRFMIFVSPGYCKIYDDMGKPEPIITINTTTTSRYAKHIAPYLLNGYTALISTQKQIPARFFDPKIKSCSRLHYGLADAEASRYGPGVQPIILDEHGYMSESSGSNVAFIKGNDFCLPGSRDFLDGCTMKFVESIIEKEERLGTCLFEIKKGNWEPYDLINSDAIVFTSTFSGLMPCYKIIYKGKTHVLDFSTHEVTDTQHKIMQLIEKFNENVGLDTEDQWRKWYEKQML